MSPLQQRMLEDMQLRGLSARTQEAYARAVWQLAQHYHRSPDQLSDEDLRQYFLYLANEKKIARPTATIALCGIKFFYEQTLKQPWPTLRFVRPPREWRLPVLAVLHTWTRAMLYHPHVHMLVIGGGLSADGKEWLPAKHATYLMPVEALSEIFRAKFCAALKKAGLLNQVPRPVWQKDWVVHCKAAGQGRQVLNYLARYIFRVAVSNSRLERFENGQVTFRYRDNRSQQLHRVTLPAQKFIYRFLLHVLPRGCAKVRYYGIWSPTCRKQLEQARTLLSTSTTTNAVDSAPNLRPQNKLFSRRPLAVPSAALDSCSLLKCCRRNQRCPHDDDGDTRSRFG